MLNISLFHNFFEKKRKTVLEAHLTSFLGKGAVLPQRLTYFFYHKWGTEYFIIWRIFQKKLYFLRKWQKNRFWGPSLFWREGDVWRRKWIPPFLLEIWFWIFFHLTVFSKKLTFLKEMGEKNFGGTWPFFRGRGHPTLKVNITFFIKN